MVVWNKVHLGGEVIPWRGRGRIKSGVLGRALVQGIYMKLVVVSSDVAEVRHSSI